jgi:hypothetical protein
MICMRCFDLLDLATANFCPRCGRNLRAVRRHTPTVEELTAFADEVSGLLPRLSELRDSLERRRRELVAHGNQPALNLVEKRLALLARVRRRLEEHLVMARRELSRPNECTSNFASA